jgi:ABC-2 type transport system permease protein
MTSLYRILLRTSMTRGRVLAFLAGGALLDLIAYSIRVSDYAARENDLFNLFVLAALALYVPVVALVFATSTLGDLAQDGSLVYVWFRPVSRWKVVVVGLAATMTVTLPLTLGPMWLAVWLAGASWQTFWAITVSTALANGAYIAVFTGLGLRVRHAMIFGLAYVVIWETFVATISVGKGPAAISIRHYTESILSHLSHQAIAGFSNSNGSATIFDQADLWPSVIVLVAVMLVGVVLTSILLSRQDVA